MEDENGKDCLLILAQEPGRPEIKLDDLIVAYHNLDTGPNRPACTIDPRQETMKLLGQTAKTLTLAKDAAGAEKACEEWKEIAVRPQDVRVFNVDNATGFAKTMVDADYDLKRVCDGTDTVKGVVGVTDLLMRRSKEQIAKKGSVQMSLDFANRFWFNPGKVSYQTDGKLVMLSTCQVKLLTEQEGLNAEGKRSPTGKGNPIAKEFADQFTAKFSQIAKAKPVYRELENLYRAVAVLGLLREKAEKANCTSIVDETLGTAEVGKGKAKETVPGRGTVKKIEGTIQGGTYVLWLPSCGGVSIDINPEDVKVEPDTTKSLPKTTQTVLAKRPGPSAVSWRFSLAPNR